MSDCGCFSPVLPLRWRQGNRMNQKIAATLALKGHGFSRALSKPLLHMVRGLHVIAPRAKSGELVGY
jgi:hypothetical protein